MVKWSLGWSRSSDGGWTLELSRSVPSAWWAPLVEVAQVVLVELAQARTGRASVVPPASRDSVSVN